MDTLTKVINIKYSKCQVYIGRTNSSNFHYGNPFRIGIHGTRGEVIDMYECWLRGTMYENVEPRRRKWILDNMNKLEGKVLGCFCSPLKCHGDILIKLLEESKEFI